MKTLHEAILGKELVKDGFELREDEHQARLYLNGQLVAVYTSSMVTLDQLRYDAVLTLNEQEGKRRQVSNE